METKGTNDCSAQILRPVYMSQLLGRPLQMKQSLLPLYLRQQVEYYRGWARGVRGAGQGAGEGAGQGQQNHGKADPPKQESGTLCILGHPYTVGTIVLVVSTAFQNQHKEGYVLFFTTFQILTASLITKFMMEGCFK